MNNEIKLLDTNYLKRKIFLSILFVLLLIVFIFQLVMVDKFITRITYEYNYIKEGTSSKNWADELVYKNSESYQLRYVFHSLNSIILILTLISLVLVFISLLSLFLNIDNGDKYYPYLTWIIPISFILLFFLLSLQPENINKVDEIQIKSEVKGEPPTKGIKKVPGIPFGYELVWSSMLLQFANIFIISIAKKSYGFITKDFILQKKPQETANLYKELQNKIKEINK
ncbi:hypothetical protein RRG46_00675 [Mycoplasmopsis cynos]|uniref:Uncharacterized protein n=1 Tax=Mycoplasmopsis cynos TaxID=171284 RepID=A0ABD8AJ58_9BACT|nr:hypothetical protein [Mycoplasmopsis cynos]UWV80716.1 hypothetical protein NW069_00690 [Mycoplasmopsis cynos]WQQ12981.1 hypothetical protein RRG58_03335 [Mycoplasmopsis cynos]WQQ14278.1 hypothetical protein RRG52_01935 [Mycoplasmopsis cynos]WQQ15235.1 hypothetical protein RRG43_02680 [Mycoplasmopsis cynos]WQQ20058.1 hypothetical protein RRG46_00675 [Mycoplasmopsis cynos]